MNLEHNGFLSTSMYNTYSSYTLPVACSIALLLVLGLAINPIIHNSSYAIGEIEDEVVTDDADSLTTGEMVMINEDGEDSGTTPGENTRATTSIGIAWTNPNNLERETSGLGGEVTYRYDTFTSTGSRIKQYQIFVNAAPGNSGQLEGYLDVDRTTPIGNIAGISNTNGVTGSSIPANQWGYALSEGYKTTNAELKQLTYKAIPASSSTTAAYTGTEEVLEEKQFTVAFGANVGNDKPAGHYTAAVQVSAVMEPLPMWSDYGLTTMQGMTSTICANAEMNTTGQLRDTRDNKTYWVTKLPDNNCWMTQNLDLDLSVQIPLTSEKSDVTSDWTPTANTSTGAKPLFPDTPSIARSWDPAGGNGKVTYCNDGGVAGKCKVGDNSATSINDGHDAQGNYYSWWTVTAGSGSSTADKANAGSSICPKGWKLPTGGASGEIRALVNGLTVAQIIAAPYYFVYGGYVSGQVLSSAGSWGEYWSATVYNGNSGQAYNLFFTTSVKPYSNSNYGYFGCSVRCVAR